MLGVPRSWNINGFHSIRRHNQFNGTLDTIWHYNYFLLARVFILNWCNFQGKTLLAVHGWIWTNNLLPFEFTLTGHKTSMLLGFILNLIADRPGLVAVKGRGRFSRLIFLSRPCKVRIKHVFIVTERPILTQAKLFNFRVFDFRRNDWHNYADLVRKMIVFKSSTLLRHCDVRVSTPGRPILDTDFGLS